MIGTWINLGAVVAGTMLGRALGNKLKPEAQATITSVLGCVTVVLGLKNAMHTPAVLGSAPVASQAGFFLAVLFSLLLGALVGEAMNLEGRLAAMGQWVEKSIGHTGGDFGRGFVTASLLFCVGPLTILGCFQDGLTGNFSLLATKSVLDGFAAMAFAAAFGWGVLLSAVTVLVVQGALTLGAGAVQPILSDPMMDAMTAAGGIMLLALGLRLLDLKLIRVANMTPALILAPLLVALCNAASPGFFPTR